MTILVLAAQDDWPTDRVVKTLTDRGADVFRLDTTEFPLAARMGARIDADQGWTGTLETDHRHARWEDITAVYYRTPGPFTWPEGMSEPERRFAAAQARSGLGGLITTLDCRWVSHPAAMSRAEYKPHQLNVARKVGLRIPPTLLTSRAQDVREFADHVGGPLIVKPVASPVLVEGDGMKTVYTKLLAPDDLVDLTGLDTTVHLFQAWVEKAYEVRLNVVGDRLFAAKVIAGSAAAHIDWRADYNSLTYETTSVPRDVASAVLRYMDEMELAFGALDFIVDEGGTWWMLECNPCGQWDWIEGATGQPISEAIADELQGVR